MSSILRALRKLEEEKSAGREGAIDIARDILRLPMRRSAKPAGWLLPLGIGMLLSGVAAAVILFWVTDIAPNSSEMTGVGVTHLPSGEAPPAQPAPEPQARQTPSAPPPPPRSYTLQNVPTQETIIEQTIAHRPVSTLRGSRPVSESKSSTLPHPVVSPPRDVGEGKSVKVLPSGSSFLLSGIVYQSDPDGRVAVINDLPVMTGTVIEGATVRDILPDRVRLAYPDGRALDLFLEP